VCYPGFVYGAAVSWALKSNRNIDLPRALDLYAFKDKAGVMGQLVYDLGNAYKEPGVLLGNQSVLFYILHNPDISINSGPYAHLTIDNLNKTRAYIDRVIQPLHRAEMDRPDAQQTIDEVANAAMLLCHACSLAIARLQTADGSISSIPENTRKQLAADLERMIDEHKRLWLLRNREGGLTDSVARMERILKLYRSN
jgi:hexosaminidase